MWDICMLKSEGEAWIFCSMILMFPLVVGHQLLLTTLTFLTHVNHVHTAPTLIIRLKIVHPWDNFLIFHMCKWTPVSLAIGLNPIQIFYNPDWSNYFDFSWQAHAIRNYASQVDKLHNLEYPQFDNQFSTPSLCNYAPEQSSLEDTLNAFREIVNQGVKELRQSMQELKDADTQATVVMEKWVD